MDVTVQLKRLKDERWAVLLNGNERKIISVKGGNIKLCTDDNSAASALIAYSETVVEGQGRSLLASSYICEGYRLTTCEPIVQPVLIEGKRSCRCSYCFKKLISYAESSSMHLHCSEGCQQMDEFWQSEALGIKQLPALPSPTVLLSSRIIRKMVSSPELRRVFDKLCWNTECLLDHEIKSYEIISRQTCALLSAAGCTSAASEAQQMLKSGLAPWFRFLSRMSLNGFTISNSEQMVLGLGIFPAASMVNHSCRPNAVPSFWLRETAPPTLQLTTCKAVTSGEEVSISYCDVSPPTQSRRSVLSDNYKFLCTCPLCLDSDRNREVLGLKRTGIEVDALVKSQLELDTAMESISLSMKRLDKLDQSIDAISTMSEYQAAREEVERVYISCRACTYVASRCSGIYSALSSDMLQLCSNEREQVQICQKALKMMSETLLASKQCLDYAGSLTWQIRMGTEAKFRLFVNPVDVDALSMLRNVKAELMKYFPPDDEMIVSLDQSLQSYSWSRS